MAVLRMRSVSGDNFFPEADLRRRTDIMLSIHFDYIWSDEKNDMPRHFSEADTRANFIDPKLSESGWTSDFIRREYYFTDGRKLLGNKRCQRLFLDYLCDTTR